MTALGRKHDQKQDDVYRVSQVARTLGRIVLLARQSRPGVGCDDLVQPANFDDVVKKLSTENEKPALNVGREGGVVGV